MVSAFFTAPRSTASSTSASQSADTRPFVSISVLGSVMGMRLRSVPSSVSTFFSNTVVGKSESHMEYTWWPTADIQAAQLLRSPICPPGFANSSCVAAKYGWRLPRLSMISHGLWNSWRSPCQK